MYSANCAAATATVDYIGTYNQPTDLYDEFITLPIPNNMLDLPTTGYFKGGLVRSGFKW